MNEKEPAYADSVENIIRKRFSIRTYSAKPLSSETRGKILIYAAGLKGPFDMKTRFEILDIADTKEKTGLKLGTYGMITGAKTFIAAAVEKKEDAMEQLGYVFEDLILYITSLGLGTCWIAGTFNKGSFSKALSLSNDEYLPAISPVGYSGAFRSPIDLILKPVKTSRKRMEWKDIFFKEEYNKPLGLAEADAYALPLEMTRLAPSASNKQPWRIISDNGNFHFYLAHTPNYNRVFPYDIQKIDMGIAMFHFESTAKEKGLNGKWDMIRPTISGLPSNYEYISTWVSLLSAA